MARSLSMNEIRKRAGRFASSWKDEPGEERQQAQSFVRDLLGVYGITETKAAAYEYRARRASTGGRGYIDALIPGLCLIEMKSAGEDLELAESQALDYIGDLADAEAPRWVVTSDFKRVRVLDLHSRGEANVEQFALVNLRAKADTLAFLAGYQLRSFGSAAQETASIKAAKIMASLYETLEASGYDDHESSVFLVRVLFCLYADDAGLWDRDLFADFVELRTSDDGADLGPQLSMLFQEMKREHRASNLDELIARFPYVNGGIFAEPLSIPSFDSEMRAKLLAASAFNWSSISPAIFGSLFQAVKNREARRELGEHYTTETNILKTLGPLFLDEFNDRFATSVHSVRDLKKLREDLGKLRVMDPACGCGNFLVVAYREMRALDLAVLKRLRELGDSSDIPTMFFTRDDLVVKLEHFAGIELEEWPARIAATALHLADHQANQAMELELGLAPDSLPLDTIETIHVGNAVRMDWTKVVEISDHTVIVGNPPFIGMNRMTSAQQEDNRIAFSLIDSRGMRTGRLDYVACWYAKAMHVLRGVRGARAAFVSTNSITQGEQARAMVPLLKGNGFAVDFGHRTFKWTSEAPGAAAVHCIIAGFSNVQRPSRKPRLFTYESMSSDPIEVPVASVTFYLSDGPDTVPAKLSRPSSPGLPNAHKGSQPTDGSGLLIEADDLKSFLDDDHARPYVRRFVQGRDMLQGEPERWCLWFKDADPRDLRGSELIKARLSIVKSERLKSPTASVRAYAEKPSLFTQDRQPSRRYFALPEVSSENRRWIPGQFFGPETIAGNKLIIFPDATETHAGLLQSSMFMAWVSTFAGRLKSDISISPALAYFPIPWPELSAQTQSEIARAFDTVVAARAGFPTSTLADLYDPLAMPETLLEAHLKLDHAVDMAFGRRARFHDNAERLSFLLESYQKREDAEALLPQAPSTRKRRA